MKQSRHAAQHTILDPAPLLLSPQLDHVDVIRILQPYGFRNFAQADANLQSMAGSPHTRVLLAENLQDMLEAVSQTADPDQALNEWDRYVELGPNRAQLFQYLRQAPRMLHVLCTIFGNSSAMAQTLIRDPLLLYWINEENILLKRPSQKALERSLDTALAPFQTHERKCEALRRFKRREMLRIGLRDLLRISLVQDTVDSLSELACLTIQKAYHLVSSAVQAEFGIPKHRHANGQLVETRFVVLGMGKLGGKELNYSSDVDLMYVYESCEGQTYVAKGQRSLSNAVYFDRLAQELTRVLSQPTQEGALFRVDLRLRPEGLTGALVHSLEEMHCYYRTRGRMWERLAYLKARPIAGSLQFGRRVGRILDSFIFGGGKILDTHILDTIRSLKAQIHRKMVQRGETDRNVKLGTGGIREVEFIVQSFQLRYGFQRRKIVERNTLLALDRLKQEGLLTPLATKRLVNAYIFLRDIEHKLQMVNELQTHHLPTDVSEIAQCAVRLGYPKNKSAKKTADTFLRDYRRASLTVHRMYTQVVGPLGLIHDG